MKALITILVVLLLAVSTYFYFTNETIRDTITKTLTSEAEIHTTITSSNAVFVIFDPSGSGSTTYNVPRITTGFIGNLIDNIMAKGNGAIWLTYIDQNSYNNDVLHFEIPEAPSKPIEPHRFAGEAMYKFNERQAQYERDTAEYAKVEKEFHASFERSKTAFLGCCRRVIDQEYQPKRPGTDWSDISGSLNTAVRSLKTVAQDSTHFRSILLISDGVQELAKGRASQRLSEIPKDIKLVQVNQSGSNNNMVAGRAQEFDNLDRGLQQVVQSIHNQ